MTEATSDMGSIIEWKTLDHYPLLSKGDETQESRFGVTAPPKSVKAPQLKNALQYPAEESNNVQQLKVMKNTIAH